VISVYLVGDRFNPAQNALVFNANGEPEAPPSAEARHAYLKNLEARSSLNTPVAKKNASREEKSWREFAEKAQFELDDSGSPVLAAPFGGEIVHVGVARDDFDGIDAPVALQKGLLVSRLHQELERGRAPKISAEQLSEDWQLLQTVNSAEQEAAQRRANEVNEESEQQQMDRALLLQ
jgi:hypothetical protein